MCISVLYVLNLLLQAESLWCWRWYLGFYEHQADTLALQHVHPQTSQSWERRATGQCLTCAFHKSLGGWFAHKHRFASWWLSEANQKLSDSRNTEITASWLQSQTSPSSWQNSWLTAQWQSSMRDIESLSFPHRLVSQKSGLAFWVTRGARLAKQSPLSPWERLCFQYDIFKMLAPKGKEEFLSCLLSDENSYLLNICVHEHEKWAGKITTS